MAVANARERFDLIRENLAEVLNPEIIQEILDKGGHPKIYWGTATTGRPHCGYFVPAIKIAQFLAAGCDVKILFADIHAILDNLKAPRELVEQRVRFYEYVITAMLEAIGVSTEKLRFVKGSSYQLKSDYVMDMLSLSALVSEHDVKKAGSEIVKQTANPPASCTLYPILQVLDEQYLDVDAQFGGMDQRKLFTAAKKWLPKLNYKERAHLLNPMVPGLHGGKMSSSDQGEHSTQPRTPSPPRAYKNTDSKIDLLDPPEVVAKKIQKAVALPRVVDENGVLSFVEFVLLPASGLKGEKRSFTVAREQDGLEPLVYDNIAQIQDDYRNDVLTPQILKPAVAKALNQLLAPIQEAFQNSKDWQDAAVKAYPPPVKEKKVRNKGSRYPGKTSGAAGDAAVQADGIVRGEVDSVAAAAAVEKLSV
ncbi:tyrosyl-tRNA synthetase [Metarhizium album ARSEF 1941]|uniref:Tyrosine--tRNA ligase n=1 Tax=Metarhizium album (strain ARSEF 1941) TaxID=1081103 RepID=A0A0B2X4P4_METAS|nr:tyrosyl-tRNA synthetase [Metarhizium album ARSEF 1941]KHO00241.1 tyrosyl-tRNA synthetase [Metarhizium album ARSEF 1941]